MEKGADFEKKYQARFNTPVQIYAPFTYDAVNVIIDAMKRANSTDRPRSWLPCRQPTTTA